MQGTNVGLLMQLQNLFAAILRKRKIRYAIEELEQLNEHILKDIGVSRSEIADVVRNGRPALLEPGKYTAVDAYDSATTFGHMSVNSNSVLDQIGQRKSKQNLGLKSIANAPPSHDRVDVTSSII